MKELSEMIAEKRQELEKVKVELATLETLQRRANGEEVQQVRKRAPRSNVKNSLLTMLETAGAAGLNAAKAVEMATARGEHLERNTVSSLLSRLKADDVVSYDGNVYRLPKFITRSADGWTGVTSHPASRVVS